MKAFLYDCVDSTNEVAKRLIDEGAIEDQAYVQAREQTAGRGTRGRSWISPRDAGIYLSVVWKLERSTTAVTTAFTKSAAVACVEAVRSRFDVDVKIKPVNDLLVNGRKLGGILTETIITGKAFSAVISGIGINTHHFKRNIPPDQTPPICLQGVVPPEPFDGFDMNSFAVELANGVIRWHSHVIAGRIDFVESAYSMHALPGCNA